MSTSTINGTIESIDIKRQHKKATVFRTIGFRLDNGGEKTVKKAIVGPELAPKLQPGVGGRFYLYSALDHKGVHGLRSRDGEAIYSYSLAMEKMMRTFCVIIGPLLLLIILATGDAPLIAVVAFIGCGFCWYSYRKTRFASRRQFDADSSYRAASAPAESGVPSSPTAHA